MAAPAPSQQIDIDDVFARSRAARELVAQHAKNTPLLKSSFFSQLLGCDILLKEENLQTTGSFKVRGALNAMNALSAQQRENGVVACSAGNHAQGIAFAARSLSVRAAICMPSTAPFAKANATEGYGAEVVVCGETFDSTFAKADELVRTKGMTFMHPYDSLDVIAGQGTIGFELLEQIQQLGVNGLDFVFVPLGGGGLAAGVATVLKKLSPQTKVFGVESTGVPSMFEALQRGEPVKLQTPTETIADGIAVATPGKLTFELAQRLLDGVVTVSDDDISHTIYYLLERAKIVVEPAGAAGLAALVSKKPLVDKHNQPIDIRGKRVACVLSGGNIDMSMLVRIVTREQFHIARLVRIEGDVPDKSACFDKVFLTLSQSDVKVRDCSFDRSDPFTPPTRAKMCIVVEVKNEDKSLPALIAKLAQDGFKFIKASK
eukprot:TRINITY_DN13342_c0_g1_i1.p1 TRINITY_DN13342_c0_g1~~TRINITY_DN13342_c0_g1_i1.p1  ORF type:complete len:447 (-),score=117.50 TRINITY_DN13342_c0_g1_i1:79-1374(-)